MKLLIVTDHRFYEYNNIVYDNYVFGRDFFKDYLNVFDDITIIGRLKRIEQFPNGYLQTSDEKIKFIGVEDIKGYKWILNNRKLLSKTNLDLNGYTHICFRIPSLLAFSVWKLNKDFKHPYMFEMIGHPSESLSFSNSFFKKILFGIIGKIIDIQTKKIVNNADCGSYVTINSLQKQYPLKSNGLSDSISSIRLEKKYILEDLVEINLEEIRIVHLGSFVPVKNQMLLIDLVDKLKSKYNIHLKFVGGGENLDKYIDIVKSKNLSKYIEFTGHIVGFENIVKELDDSNFFILPSFSEGMPRAMIEAMARGLVCLGSKRGGITELLDENFLFEPNDLESLEKSLENILSNKQLITKSREENLKKARSFEQETLRLKRINLLKYLKSH